ncbi:MAG TPA: hypothetical protein VMU89_11360 [Thermomicrobiaceae bacterium]|nr:hypothetical protein [Thermomicrobiaceae bacterium]
MIEYDPGPPLEIADILAAVPDCAPHRDYFWYDWGPVFYRGRLDGSSRLLCVASDPGPTERIALRTLVGDAGQRVQGFLAKLGLSHSYLCLNAFAYGLIPSQADRAGAVLRDPRQVEWRNALFTGATGPSLQAIVAFGVHARDAVRGWDPRPDVPVFDVPHPSSRDQAVLLARWRDAIDELRSIVTPDPDASPPEANYGAAFTEADYARIPSRDLPFGLPGWVGDDAWGRRATPPHRNSVWRPQPDDRHTLICVAPRG